MIAIRSLVLGTLLTVCQYVECQDQEFSINSPFPSFSTFARSSRTSRATLPQNINRANFNDQIDDQNSGESNEDPNLNLYAMSNGNRKFLHPAPWGHNNIKSRLRQRRSRNHYNPGDIRQRAQAPNVESILRWIGPDIPALDDIDINLPLANSLPLPQLGRRSNPHHENNDNDSACQTSIKNILLKIKAIKENIQDLDKQVMECIGSL